MPRKKPQRLTRESIETLNILVYANQGTGKTVFAGTAADVPEMKDVLVLNIEGGLLSIAEREDLLVLDVKKVKDVEDVFWSVAQKEEGYDTIKTVVIDSATALQEISMKEIRTRRGRKEGETQIQDWGESTQTLRDLFRQWRDLPVHTIVTALVKKDFEGDVFNPGPLSEVRPSLTSSLCNSVMGYMDFVLYMFKEEKEEKIDGKKIKVVKRKALTTDYGVMRAKMRSPRLAEEFGTIWEEPNVPDLYNAWQQITVPEGVAAM